jgi:methionyl-tRNA synthetase
MDMLQGVNIYILLAIFFWMLPWKAWALWLAVKRGDIWWYLAMLVLGTLGILEIIYIFFVAKQGEKILPEEQEKS